MPLFFIEINLRNHFKYFVSTFWQLAFGRPQACSIAVLKLIKDGMFFSIPDNIYFEFALAV